MKLSLPFIRAEVRPEPVKVSSIVADIQHQIKRLDSAAVANDAIAEEARKAAVTAEAESSYARLVAGKFRELIA